MGNNEVMCPECGDIVPLEQMYCDDEIGKSMCKKCKKNWSKDDEIRRIRQDWY